MKLPRLVGILIATLVLVVAVALLTRTVVLNPSTERPPESLPTAGNLPSILNASTNANGSPSLPEFLAADLRIPSLGIEAPIIYSESNDEETFQRYLEDGIVHYPGTAYPGELGNAFIVGHSSDYLYRSGNYKRIFAKLPTIQIDDDILVYDNKGGWLTFNVIETKIVNPDQLEVLDQMNYERRLLTLQTSYPVNTARQRFIVVSELVE